MRPITFTITGVGSQIVPLDWQANPQNVAIQAVVGTGTPTYEVDATLDNPYTTTPNWSVLTAAIASAAQGNITKVLTPTTTPGLPVTALRCNVTVSATTVTFTIVQSGGTGAA
jgi:hypothetical protein